MDRCQIVHSFLRDSTQHWNIPRPPPNQRHFIIHDAWKEGEIRKFFTAIYEYYVNVEQRQLKEGEQSLYTQRCIAIQNYRELCSLSNSNSQSSVSGSVSGPCHQARFYELDESDCFLGPIMCYDYAGCHQVVDSDGQQRLLTLSLILHEIIVILSESAKANGIDDPVAELSAEMPNLNIDQYGSPVHGVVCDRKCPFLRDGGATFHMALHVQNAATIRTLLEHSFRYKDPKRSAEDESDADSEALEAQLDFHRLIKFRQYLLYQCMLMPMRFRDISQALHLHIRPMTQNQAQMQTQAHAPAQAQALSQKQTVIPSANVVASPAKARGSKTQAAAPSKTSAIETAAAPVSAPKLLPDSRSSALDASSIDDAAAILVRSLSDDIDPLPINSQPTHKRRNTDEPRTNKKTKTEEDDYVVVQESYEKPKAQSQKRAHSPPNSPFPVLSDSDPDAPIAEPGSSSFKTSTTRILDELYLINRNTKYFTVMDLQRATGMHRFLVRYCFQALQQKGIIAHEPNPGPAITSLPRGRGRKPEYFRMTNKTVDF